MKGSSEGAWQSSDSCRELSSSSLRNRELSDSSRGLNSNLRNLRGSTNRFSRDTASHDYGFIPVRKGREKALWPRIHNYSTPVGADDGDEVRGPVVKALECNNVSLRHWLDNPQRAVNALECFHIYSQIVDIVNEAHSHGNVVQNVRPSCFVMSSFNHVSFVEAVSFSEPEHRSNSRTAEIKCSSWSLDSFSYHSSGSLKGTPGPWLASNPVNADSRLNSETNCLQSNSAQVMHSLEDISSAQTGDEKHSFSMKQMMLMESNWYSSPEEIVGDPISGASDIYRLGVLLFELFYTSASLEEKCTTMENLRHRVFPSQLLLKWPKEVSFCLWLLHPEPSNRPKISELLRSYFLNSPRDVLDEQEAIIDLPEKIEEQELLLEFLMLLQQRKHDASDSLSETIAFIAEDVEEVTKLQTGLRLKGDLELKLDKSTHSSSDLMKVAPHDDFGSSGSRKRTRQEFYTEPDDSNCIETRGGDQGSILSRSSRLMKNFQKLESAYYSTRRRDVKATSLPLPRHSLVSSDGKRSAVVTERSCLTNPRSKEMRNERGKSGWINTFLEGLCKYLSFSMLKVKADLKQGDLLNSSNLICSLSFDRDGEFFATAGVSKKIKVFEYNSILNGDRDIRYPVVEMASGTKLSSVCWSGYIKSQIASSNFEGVVQVWDATRSQIFLEMKEHERRVWSVDFSMADPTMLASGSDDGSVKLWNINQGASVGTIKTKANVCCVQFPSDSAHCLAFGSADHRIYYYDLRNSKMPLCTLVGHHKTVSYVKFIDSTTLVSASTDNTLKLWDLSMCNSRVLDCPMQSFTGHLNVKNFVGLSVSEGFIATGSETNEVFVYHKALPMPALSCKFNSSDAFSVDEVDDSTQFVSSVCWRGQSSTLVAANSMGHIKVLEMA
ncbi:protein SPA1-RELATED 4-like isoform X1 [Primulina tabacum]|uniref:protein SPA1-RELATED 4-like isoform X1 n=1 Tax=Primulina tabacum TaxID=48773 RepID=UPI003F59EC33